MYVLASEGLFMKQAYATAVILVVIVIAINAASSYLARKLMKGPSWLCRTQGSLVPSLESGVPPPQPVHCPAGPPPAWKNAGYGRPPPSLWLSAWRDQT